MSDYVSDIRTTAFADRLWLLAERLLGSIESKAGHPRLPRELASLPDHLLIDIGVDPRWVPNPAGETISRPDLSHSGLATPIWRSAAKS
jgi:hypothetical protein